MKTFLFLFIILIPGSNIPDINKKIVEYVDSVIGQKVDTGECWDLAAAALDYSGAYFDRTSKKTIYQFGKVINPQKDIVYPGDIIQMENVILEYEDNNYVYTENMGHHTAIIYEILDNGHYKIAHQNTSFSGRKVGVSELNLTNVKKGKILFYRPFKK